MHTFSRHVQRASIFTAIYFRHSAAPREIVVATTPYGLMVGLVEGPDSGVPFVSTQDEDVIK